jgi:hypothetical protein
VLKDLANVGIKFGRSCAVVYVPRACSVRASSRGVLVDGAGVAPASLWLRKQEIRVALGSRPSLT